MVGCGVCVAVGAGVCVAVGGGTGVCVAVGEAGVCVAVGGGTGVCVAVGGGGRVCVAVGGTGVCVAAGDGTAVCVAVLSSPSFSAPTVAGEASAVGLGRIARSTALGETPAAGVRSAIHIKIKRDDSAPMAQARSNVLAAVTGHHRAGASRVPPQARQNISPAARSFPHHLHC